MAKKEKTEDQLHKIPLRVTDTTLRDAHQSLWATRMRTDDMMKIIDVIDNVGYYSLECWGGATFDVCLRFLRENPWERLKMIKEKAKKTPLQMLLRGQNLVGYRNYADDVVDRFVKLACENGVDIFRVFDALNDTRNLEAAIKAVKRHGGHAQGTLCYTISPVHTIEKYVKYAKDQKALGIDSLCIKDMAGILTPISAERLVKALINELNIPIQLHCHMSSGMATATYVEAVRAGAGAIDCAISSMSGASSQPPVETMAAIFSETNYSPGLDVEALEKIAKYFEELQPKRRQSSASTKFIDPGILVHQIPGGMISNFRSQLEMQKALDKLPEVLNEVARVREDLGFPPLVTPTSQIVGTQAVMNVISGERYKIVPNEVKSYLKGMYGRSPATVKSGFMKMILGDEKPITHRPADKLSPMLPKATDGIDPKFIEGEEDIISYVILPEPALEYFKYRATPADQRPDTPADLEVKKLVASQTAPVGTTNEKVVSSTDAQGKSTTEVPSKFQGIANELMEKIDDIAMEELIFRKGDFTIAVRPSGVASSYVSPPVKSSPKNVATVSADSVNEAKPEPVPVSANEEKAEYPETISAPLTGTFYGSPGSGKERFVNEGDIVNKGDKICVVEAMKLFNPISAPVKCRVIKFLADDGQMVEKGQPLIGIEPV